MTKTTNQLIPGDVFCYTNKDPNNFVYNIFVNRNKNSFTVIEVGGTHVEKRIHKNIYKDSIWYMMELTKDGFKFV